MEIIEGAVSSGGCAIAGAAAGASFFFPGGAVAGLALIGAAALVGCFD